MGYVGEELVDQVPVLEAGIRRFGRSVSEAVGEDLRKRVRRHTPISKPGAPEIVASYPSSGAWRAARGGRRSGTLYDSWQVGEVGLLYRGDVFRVPVFTMDPVAPHVEWDTMPHLIVPKKPGGVLTIPTRTGMVFATLVHHPGTRGAHMMATALQEVAVSWRTTVRAEWAEAARTIWTARGFA